MTPEQRRSWALQLQENPVLAETLDELEFVAITAITIAEPSAHDVRQAKAAELRAIRDLHDRIRDLAIVREKKLIQSIA